MHTVWRNQGKFKQHTNNLATLLYLKCVVSVKVKLISETNKQTDRRTKRHVSKIIVTSLAKMHQIRLPESVGSSVRPSVRPVVSSVECDT